MGLAKSIMNCGLQLGLIFERLPQEWARALCFCTVLPVNTLIWSLQLLCNTISETAPETKWSVLFCFNWSPEIFAGQKSHLSPSSKYMVFCRSNRGWAHLVRCTPGILVYGEYFVDNPKVHNHLYLMTEVHPTLARRIDIRCLNWWLRSSGRWDLALYVLRLSQWLLDDFLRSLQCSANDLWGLLTANSSTPVEWPDDPLW